MSRIAAEELPTPVIISGHHHGWGPVASGAGAARRTALGIAGGVLAVALGAFGILQLSDDRSATSSDPTVTVASSSNGSAGNSTLSEQQIAAAYTLIFGTAANSATLSCIDGQVGAEGGEAARLAQGESLTYEQALDGFVPFADCAPDTDFVGVMLAPTVQLFENGADETCVATNLASFNLTDRTEALALALTSPAKLSNRLYDYFTPCAF